MSSCWNLFIKLWGTITISQEDSGVNDKESSDEEEVAIVIETDQSKPVSHTAAYQSKLVSYTDSNSEEEEDLHVDVNFDEPIDLAIN